MPKTSDKRNLANREKLIGMKIKASNGQMMICTDYNGVYDMTVKFEDGTVVEHVYKCSFLRGNVKNPNKPCRNNNVVRHSVARDRYIGMKVLAKNGMEMECIDYLDYSNITVRFDNGMLRTNVGVTEFLQGLVRENKHQRYVGTKVTSKNDGQVMECIEYFSNTNITVRFEDGTIVYNKPVSSFLKGTIKNPNVPRKSKFKEDHKGEESITSQGYRVKIIEYNNSSDMTVQFTDGFMKKASLASFKSGSIGYPLSQDLKRPFAYNGYTAQFVFKDCNHAYYACSCPKCGFDEILTASEMLIKHECNS